MLSEDEHEADEDEGEDPYLPEEHDSYVDSVQEQKESTSPDEASLLADPTPMRSVKNSSRVKFSD